MTDPTAPPVNPLALEEQVCFALAVAARNVVALYRPLLEPMGLTHPQYLVMLALWEHDSMTVGELSAALQLTPATLSPLLRRLEAQDYLHRGRHRPDERVVHVTLTPRGRELRAEALRVPAAVVERLGVDLADLERLRGELQWVIERSQQEVVPAAG
ncbi:MAG: MarR family transcriptional regulator [Nocardioidaceae bacterium]|nr:MarR family transcriptional regulator [Nocardioidaceae bacterium]NUS52035.1 MarR family transcriptional regulator [Nocardioidaceae bacterium]